MKITEFEVKWSEYLKQTKISEEAITQANNSLLELQAQLADQIKSLNKFESNVAHINFKENKSPLDESFIGHLHIKNIQYTHIQDFPSTSVPSSHTTFDKTLTGHSNYVMALTALENDELIASGSFDNTIKIWNVSTGTLIKTLEGHAAYIYALIKLKGKFFKLIKFYSTSTYYRTIHVTITE